MGTTRLSNVEFGAFKPIIRKPLSTLSSPSSSPIPQGPIPSPSPEPEGPSITNSPTVFFYKLLVKRKEANLSTLKRISPISREIDQKELQLEQEQVEIINLLIRTCVKYCDPSELQAMVNPSLLATTKVNHIIDEIKGTPSPEEKEGYEKARVILGHERNKLEKELRKFLEEQEDDLDNGLKQSFTSLRAREDYSNEFEKNLCAAAEMVLNNLEKIKKSIKDGVELSHGLIIMLDNARLKFVTEKIQLEANLIDYLATPEASKTKHFRV